MTEVGSSTLEKRPVSVSGAFRFFSTAFCPVWIPLKSVISKEFSNNGPKTANPGTVLSAGKLDEYFFCPCRRLLL